MESSASDVTPAKQQWRQSASDQARRSTDVLRAEHYLALWARWMRSSDLRSLWYGSHSLCGAHSEAGADFEEMADGADKEAAKMTDALVRGLPPAQSAALHRKWLHAVYRFPRDNYPAMLLAATEAVGAQLHSRYGLP